MKGVALAILLFSLLSCSSFQDKPDVHALSSTKQNLHAEILQGCEQTFFKEMIQFVHSIVFKMADGHGATVIGVTVLDGDTLKSGLMGVEGFVFFEAIQKKDSKPEVNRALPPFDNPGFAAGLMQDVRTLFQEPSDPYPSVGMFADGTPVCRYVAETGRTTDVRLVGDGSREITVYDAANNKERSVIMSPRISVNGLLVPEKLQLKAYGIQGYSLNMKLISAEKIKNINDLK